MSSALAMVLTAAMVVPASGPEMVSGEIEDRLDLSGAWEGTMLDESGSVFLVCYGEGLLQVGMPGITFTTPFEPIEEGHGRFRLNDGQLPVLGIYKWESGRVFICRGYPGKARPPSFHVGIEQHSLIILHRVQPGK